MPPEQHILQDFAKYLVASSIAVGTIKNYTSDLSHFFSFLSSGNQYVSLLTLPFILTPSLLLQYKNHLSSSPLTTANRRLSSLRKFCQFTIAAGIVTSVDLSQLTNIPPTISPSPEQKLLTKFSTHLQFQGASSNTIKNYTSDARIHLLGHNASTTPTTIKRRQSALRHFHYWQSRSLPTPTLPFYPSPSIPIPSDTPFLIGSLIFAALCLLVTAFLILKSNRVQPYVVSRVEPYPFVIH